MKNLVTLTLTLTALAFAGCASGPQLSKPSPEQGATAVRITVSTAATLSLAKNPLYIPAAEALVAGIDAIATENAQLSPAVIARFVADVCARKGLPPTDAIVFTSLAQTIYTAYVSTYQTQVVSTADPTVKLYIGAFRDGLNDALAILAAQPTPAAK